MDESEPLLRDPPLRDPPSLKVGSVDLLTERIFGGLYMRTRQEEHNSDGKTGTYNTESDLSTTN